MVEHSRVEVSPNARLRRRLAMAIAAAAVIAGAFAPLPAAAAPQCNPKADAKPGAEDPQSLEAVSLFCSDNCNATQTDYNNCEAAWGAALSNVVVKKPGDDDEKGVCKVATAEANFYKSVPKFNSIRSDLAEAIDGLRDPSKAGSGPYADSNFGPAGNAGAQQQGRAGIKTYLEGVLNAFESNVKTYATLSRPDCFQCSAMERWAILKSAANLAAYSHDYPGDGYKVGLGSKTVLEATGIDNETNAPAAADARRKIAVKFALPKKADRPDTVDLNEVTDQWVMALSPKLIKDLQREICKLVNKTDTNIYADGKLYFDFARNVQRRVNEAFTQAKLIEEGGKVRQTEFEQATIATKNLTSRRKMTDVAKALTDKQCSQAGMDLRPHSNFRGEAYDPRWCADFKDLK